MEVKIEKALADQRAELEMVHMQAIAGLKHIYTKQIQVHCILDRSRAPGLPSSRRKRRHCQLQWSHMIQNAQVLLQCTRINWKQHAQREPPHLMS